MADSTPVPASSSYVSPLAKIRPKNVVSGNTSKRLFGRLTQICDLRLGGNAASDTIKGRVLAVTFVTRFVSSPVFNVVFRDGSDTIRVAIWGEKLISTFNEKFQVGKLYELSNFDVKSSTKSIKFTWVKNSKNISVHRATQLVEIEEVDGDEELYPFYDFKFTAFNNIEEKSPGTIIDVIGYVLNVQDPEIVPKTNSTKRKVTILDQLDREVCVTFYNTMADIFNSKLDPENGSVVAFGGLGVTSYDGGNVPYLDGYDDTILSMKPACPEAEEIWDAIKIAAKKPTVTTS